ncbi:GNAT family N-acetyltransferase [Streptomyces longisporoflavus]|uniref:GNAT family N-acetyltransferase n=1 Tax=Streptomyces longisporoflavus TaxID=28044 RepID=A0ABW7R785_9ACTN
MGVQIREYSHLDEEHVLDLSLRAWAPVFASMRHVQGEELFLRLHGDWREYQRKAVQQVLSESAMQVWVAETDGRVAGFVAATVSEPDRLIGEVSMLAVDPDAQGSGIGARLTEHATAWLRDAGMQVAMIDTGGDPGHAPARHVYEKADYTLMPVARYFKAL